MDIERYGPSDRLEEIRTETRVISDPGLFASRYGPAMRSYLRKLLRDSDGTDDVLQEVLLRFACGSGGRSGKPIHSFRRYLKRALRNAAATYRR